MSKKTTPRPKIAKEGFTNTGLPTPDKVDQAVEQIATARSAPGKKAITADDLRTPAKRAAGLTNKGRARLTTMLRPDLRAQLETIAQNRQISIADVLELIIVDYLDALKK